MPHELDGRVAIVTGGSAGIGRATAGMLASRGALVTIFARTAVSEKNIAAVDGDVSDPEAIERLFVETESRFGDCDILVNCAGMIDPKPLVDVTPEGVVQIRFHGACHGCPSSTMTLQMGIERNVRERVPEVTAVVAVQ